MPTLCYNPPWEHNGKLWNKCLNDIKALMLASGWNKHAGKFSEVQLRKAHKLFNSIYYRKK